MAKCIPTLNHFGYQASTPTAMLSYWLESYDGMHSLLDIGCAFGINTLKALEKDIPIVAMDPEVKHLDELRSKVLPKYSNILTCEIGRLPNNILCPDNYFSGILCSEVLHFLDGNEVEKALKVFHKKLIKGGKLFITTMSHRYLIHIIPERANALQRDIAAGVKWPGVMYLDEEFLAKYENLTVDEEVRITLRQQFPVSSLLHLFTKERLVEELECIGFSVTSAQYGEQDGIDPHGMGNVSGLEIFIIAEKI